MSKSNDGVFAKFNKYIDEHEVGYAMVVVFFSLVQLNSAYKSKMKKI